MHPEVHALFVTLKQDLSKLKFLKSLLFPPDLKKCIRAYPDYPDDIKAYEICQELFDTFDWLWLKKQFKCLEPIKYSELGHTIRMHPGLFFRPSWAVGYEIFKAVSNHSAPGDLVMCLQHLDDACVFRDYLKTRLILDKLKNIDEPIRLRGPLCSLCHADVFQDSYAMEYLDALVSEKPEQIDDLVYLLLRLKDCVAHNGYISQKFDSARNSLYHKTLKSIRSLSLEGDLSLAKKSIFLLKREKLLEREGPALSNMNRVLTHPYPEALYKIMVVLYERTMRNEKETPQKQDELDWLLNIKTDDHDSKADWQFMSELVLQERDIVTAINRYLDGKQISESVGNASCSRPEEAGVAKARQSFSERVSSECRPCPLDLGIINAFN